MTPNAPPSNGGTSDTALKAAFKEYLAHPDTAIAGVVNPVQERLREHFGVEPLTLATAAESYTGVRMVPMQLAVNEFLAEPGRTYVELGVNCPSVPDYWMGVVTFSQLLSRPTFAFVPPAFCPIDRLMRPCGYDKELACINQGIVLFDGPGGPGAMWFRYDWLQNQFTFEAAAPTQERADEILAWLRETAVRLNPFKGQLLEVIGTLSGPEIKFLPRPDHVSADEVILPEGMLRQIERHTLGVIKAQDALINSGRPLKRGLLLHGRPGTGKTHTIKYLLGQMPDATVVIMSAGRMHHLHVLHDVMDMIVPGVIVLDDVDLVAEDRELAGARQSLFALLNLLDGVAEDRDLLFLMTTNRPNEIEPAIAARPGRVDQAIEVPLPDAECRRRLFDLYADGLNLQASADEMAEIVERTDGVTASFMREMLRRATVSALRRRDGDGTGGTANGAIVQAPISVTGADVLGALDALLNPDNPLTPVLLGAEPRHAVPTIAVRD